MPHEICIPTHDNLILRPINHEEKTAGGIILAQPGEYDNLRADGQRKEQDREIPTAALRRRTDRFEVLAVGPGQYVDASDDLGDGVFLRRPMQAEVGDTVIAQEGPKPFPCDGEILYVAKDWQILARVVEGRDGKEEIEPLSDYIFAKEHTFVQKSAGGITMVGAEDPTGNERMPIRYEAAEVSEGPFAVAFEKGRAPRFERRPMTVRPKDIFAYDGRGFEVHVAGGTRTVVQDCMVACLFQ